MIEYNLISNEKQDITIVKEKRTTVSFYKYFTLNEPYVFRKSFYCALNSIQALGRVYIAHEGINAQISIPLNKINNLRSIIYTAHPKLKGLRINIALGIYDNNKVPFLLLRVKIRKHIIADGIDDYNFDSSCVGDYLKAEEVNSMMDDPNVLIVDMRNQYEHQIGHFYKAIKIASNTFRELLSIIVRILQQYKNKKIIIYCTGGIRCEKASAWMLYNGFKHIYQVEGGIIGYVTSALEKKLPIKFIGKNFVFDGRMSELVTSDIISHCYQCQNYCDTYVNCINHKCNLLFIQCIKCKIKYQQCCSIICQKIVNFTKLKSSINNA